MKILLVNPPIPTESFSSKLITQPLGLAYLAAVLEKNGYKVQIEDMPALKANYAHLANVIEKEQPDIVGITCSTLTFKKAIQCGMVAKKVNPNIKVVMGGPHVTFTDVETLERYPCVDIIVRGEGEYTFLELVQKLEKNENINNVLGITYRENNAVKRNSDRPLIPNLDELTFPARHLLPLKNYETFGMKCPSFSVLSSRGCPYTCRYCVVRKIFGNRYRERSPENVLDEIEEIINTYGVTHISFVDDIFTIKPKNTEKFCELIKKRGLEFTWDCETRVDKVSKSLLRKMRDAGCGTIYYGVESGDPSILRKMGKKIQLAQTIKAFRWTQEANISTVASVILFYPGETKNTLNRTLNFIKKLNPDIVQFNIATPFPGTDFYEEVKKGGLISETDWSKFDILSPVYELPDFTRQEMRNIWGQAYFNFYMRPKYLLQLLLKRRFLTLKALFHMVVDVLRSNWIKKIFQNP